MTPKSQFMDPAWDLSVPIWPGMGLMKTVGENVSLINGVGTPYALASFYMGGDGIDEITNQGVNAVGAWVMGPDAEAEIMSPAFDESLSWAEPVDGTLVLVHAYASGPKRGKLCPAGTALATTKPFAKLIKVNSSTKITIGGLTGREA